MMQSLGRRYVRFFNGRYRRSGTLREGRYIEMNSVRAGMVAHPEEYAWSGYTANGQGKTDALVTPHKLHLELGFDAAERQHKYQTLFEYEADRQFEDNHTEATNKGWDFWFSAF